MINIKVISESSSVIKTILNKQRINKNSYYKRTIYSRQVLINDGYLIYHTMTGALIYLTQDEYSMIKTEKIYYNNKFNELIENYFLVPVEFNEKNIADQIFSLNNLIVKNTYCKYVVLPTTVCNARCYYCFELGKKYYSMDSKTANDVADYIVANSKSDKIDITWFGGEPLCNVNAINIICKKIKDSGKSLNSKMVSNGFLINNDIVDKAVNFWNLKNIQITLDGTEEIYNKTKAYVNCKENAFNKVVNNIDLMLSKDIKVRVRLNVSLENADDLVDLCLLLSKKYKDNKRFSVYTAIVKNHSKNDKPTLDFDKTVITEKIIKLNETIFELGIGYRDILTDKIKNRFCIADDDNCLVIHPNGEIGKCEFYIDNKLIGNIYNNTIDNSNLAKWKKYKKTRLNCNKCLHYPLCFELDECPICFDDCDDNDIKLKNYLLDKKIINTYNASENKFN